MERRPVPSAWDQLLRTAAAVRAEPEGFVVGTVDGNFC